MLAPCCHRLDTSGEHSYLLMYSRVLSVPKLRWIWKVQTNLWHASPCRESNPLFRSIQHQVFFIRIRAAKVRLKGNYARVGHYSFKVYTSTKKQLIISIIYQFLMLLRNIFEVCFACFLILKSRSSLLVKKWEMEKSFLLHNCKVFRIDPKHKWLEIAQIIRTNGEIDRTEIYWQHFGSLREQKVGRQHLLTNLTQQKLQLLLV